MRGSLGFPPGAVPRLSQPCLPRTSRAALVTTPAPRHIKGRFHYTDCTPGTRSAARSAPASFAAARPRWRPHAAATTPCRCCRRLLRQRDGRIDHRPFKTEVIERHSWPNLEAVELATLNWQHWCNHKRLLEPIGYVPPVEAEAAYYQQPGEMAEAA